MTIENVTIVLDLFANKQEGVIILFVTKMLYMDYMKSIDNKRRKRNEKVE